MILLFDIASKTLTELSFAESSVLFEQLTDEQNVKWYFFNYVTKSVKC